jgi:hypothetical protein
MKFSVILATLFVPVTVTAEMVTSVQIGPRPFWLVGQMRPSALKDTLSK